MLCSSYISTGTNSAPSLSFRLKQGLWLTQLFFILCLCFLLCINSFLSSFLSISLWFHLLGVVDWHACDAFPSFSGLMVGCAVQIPEQWVYQTHPAWQTCTGRFVPALRLFLHQPVQKCVQLLISPNSARPLQTNAVGLSLKPITTTPTPTSLVVWKQSCVYFSWLAVQIGGTLPLSTNQDTSTMYHELEGGDSAFEVLEWEGFEASGFTAGRVSVSMCVYVCMRDIFFIFQTEWIWSDSLLDWIIQTKVKQDTLGFVTDGMYQQILHFCLWFPVNVPDYSWRFCQLCGSSWKLLLCFWHERDCACFIVVW